MDRADTVPALIAIELVVQHAATDTTPSAHTLDRSMHRVPAGTTIRQFLGQQAASLIADIDTRQRGLSRFGKRAWLDDPLHADDRIEIMLPVLADAKAARFERVARARAAKADKKGKRNRRPRP